MINNSFTRNSRGSERARIGLLFEQLEGNFEHSIWPGFQKLSIERKLDLFIYLGRILKQDRWYAANYNLIYDLIKEGNGLDGLVMNGFIFNCLNEQEIKEFIDKLPPIPTVSLFRKVEGAVSIIINNRQPILEMVEHLVNCHGYRRIAFISGPLSHPVAQIRFQAYKDGLERAGLPFDSSLVAYSEYYPIYPLALGEQLAPALHNMDAIVASSDLMAWGVIDELDRRGIRVPEDIAVTGFDDFDPGERQELPLTTIRQPFREIISSAMDETLAMIESGKREEKLLEKPCSLILRRSCGCPMETGYKISPHYDYTSYIWNYEDVKGRYLDRVTGATAGKDLASIDRHELFANIFDCISTFQSIGFINKFWELGYNYQDLTESVGVAGVNRGIAGIADALIKTLKKVEIKSCYMVLYKNVVQNSREFSIPQYSDLVLAYRDGEKIELPGGSKVFPTEELVPECYLPQERRHSQIVLPLFFEERQFGYILFELNSVNPALYNGIIRGQISNALETAYIMDELKDAKEQAVRASKAKSNFFANISHELKTPLTFILSPLEAMLEGRGGELTEEQERILASVKKNGLRLLNQINTLLDFSKIDEEMLKINKEKTEVVRLLKYFTSVVAPVAEVRDIKLKFESASERVIAWIDRDLIEKACFNLISNAFKFTANGGAITISLDELDEEKFTISVKDNGLGIPYDKQDVIFERFSRLEEQTNRSYEGTGIGLSFTREIVRLHKGAISVDSSQGEGAIFTLTLPYGKSVIEIENDHEPIAEILSVKPSLISDIGTIKSYNSGEERKGERRAKIMIVEDNDSMREFLASIVDDDYDTICLPSGEAAMEVVLEEAPDLILSDLMMPGMSGYELCDSIKKLPGFNHVPIIILTARSEISKRLEGFEYGADDYMAKPFNAMELLSRIKVFIKREELRKELDRKNRELEEKNRELARLATRDSLTGLLNHAAVHEKLNKIFASGRGRLCNISVIMLDIDYFKSINDNYGHQVGDRIIREVARSISIETAKFTRRKKSRCSLSLKSYIGRYGGDEFILILNGYQAEDIEALTERIYNGVNSISLLGLPSLRLTTSIGCARLFERAYCSESKQLIKLADEALYRAKRNGRNQIAILDFVRKNSLPN